MIYFALGAVVVIAGILGIYYRLEKNNVHRRVLKTNMIGIVVLLLIIAIGLFKGCINHDDTPADQENVSSQ
jgi:chromate transport protein ChrA